MADARWNEHRRANGAETDLEGLYDLIADVRTIGDHRPLVADRSGRLYGFVNYYRASHSFPGLEIGFRIFSPEDRGKGFMTEAVGLFVAYLFAAEQIERVQALAHPENVGSRRVLERCGFLFEGILRRAHFNRGEYTDLAMYSILRADARPLEELLVAVDG